MVNKSGWKILVTILLAPIAATSAADRATEEQHHYLYRIEKPHVAVWGYKGDSGPDRWGDLSQKYILARTGRRQSPIDIAETTRKELPDIEFRYQPSRIQIVYNGHTVEDVQDEKSVIVVDGQDFHLKQFHFHSPSEHTINGRHYPMEMHLVHASESGRIAVVGVMIDEGNKENAAFAPVWRHLPTEENKVREYRELVDTDAMLPKKRTYFRYDGSFTTPPCTEDVIWLVMTKSVRLSGKQIAAFQEVIRGNNRPVQPLNGRVVTRQVR